MASNHDNMMQATQALWDNLELKKPKIKVIDSYYSESAKCMRYIWACDEGHNRRFGSSPSNALQSWTNSIAFTSLLDK